MQLVPPAASVVNNKKKGKRFNTFPLAAAADFK